jgi:uncharacterized membrane protein YebE (DUF533 family)
MRAEQLLDSLLGAKAQPTTERDASPQRSFIEEALSAFGPKSPSSTGIERPDQSSRLVGNFGDLGSSLGNWADRAREAMGRNPLLTGGALGGLGGLLLGSLGGRGIMGGLARMGGLALIGTLAYKAFQKFQENRNLGEAGSSPNMAALHPATATEADTEIYLRAMVAAIAADGTMDASEREKICEGFKKVGIHGDDADWLNRELANPARPEQLAVGIATPEKASQVYAAARLAIDPDTDVERVFLDKLASALKLDPQLRSELDKGAASVKMNA